MAPIYIDTHAHLFYKEYKDSLPIVIERAKKEGVRYIIVPGIDLDSSKKSVKLAEQNECLYVCVGIHPHDVSKASDKDLIEIEQLSKHKKVVGIGEIGLDYHYDFSPREKQKEFFAAQLEIAVKENLPVVIHTRESFEDTFNIVESVVKKYTDWNGRNADGRRGVFHCFPGNSDEAKKLISLGFFISYPGVITFKKNPGVDVVRAIGLKNILLETDSPYMTPEPLRGKRNEPANIIYVGRKVAEILNIQEKDVSHITTDNSIKLFSLPTLSYT